MINTEAIRYDHGFVEYGPLTKTQTMIEAMDIRAQEISRQYSRHEVALLAEALGSVGMNMLDLSHEELDELAEAEGTIEIKYAINEQDDDGTE